MFCDCLLWIYLCWILGLMFDTVKIFCLVQDWYLSGLVCQRYCVSCHRGVQLILACSWARPVTLVAGKGRVGNVFILSVSLLKFLFLFLPCPSLSPPLLSLFSLSLGDNTKLPTRIDMLLNPNTIKKQDWYMGFETSHMGHAMRRLVLGHMQTGKALMRLPKQNANMESKA